MLSTIIKLKLHLGVTVKTKDEVLTQILTQVDKMVKTMIGRTVEETTYSGVLFDGDDQFT